MRKVKNPGMFVCLLSLFAFGCSEETNNYSPTEPDVPTYRVILEGDADGGVGVVTYEDKSSTNPPGGVSLGAFTLRKASGGTVGTRSLVGGCPTAPQSPCTGIFTGVAPGDYVVDHVVTPSDGGPDAVASYPVTVE